MFIHKYTIFALEGIYLKNINNKTNKQTEQKRKRNKKEKDGRRKESQERVLSRIRNPAPCQKLYEHKVNVLQTIFKRLYSYFAERNFS